jgi:hypothetical protein
MKRLFIPLITATILATSTLSAQDSGMTISLKGDTGTEQAAKLELIRILQERLNKLTVSQLNSRIIVSKGVAGYYKVDEIVKMNQDMYAYRSKYVSMAQKIETGNPGFSAHNGNGFTYKYIVELNTAVAKAKALNDQLSVVLKSGQPIILPAMPSFNISPSSSDPGADLAAAMDQILSSYGVHSQSEFDQLPQAKQDEIKAKMNEAAKPLMEEIQKQVKNSNKQVLATLGNIVGTAFGVPGAGNMLVGLASGSASAIAGLVGSIVDNFQIPTDYYDSNTLKLTDAERIKIIDELHVRMSDLYQQVSALGTSLSNETKVRYNELSQPRNEVILYGPKK